MNKAVTVLTFLFAAISVFAKFETIQLPLGDDEVAIDYKNNPCKVKSIEIWSTDADAQVNVNRIRKVDAYTNAYDVTVSYTDSVERVVDSYLYAYQRRGTSEIYYDTNFTTVASMANVTIDCNTNGSCSASTSPRLHLAFDSSSFIRWSGQASYFVANGYNYWFNTEISVSDPDTKYWKVMGFDNVNVRPYTGPLYLDEVRIPYTWHYVTNAIPVYTTNRTWKVKSATNFNTNVILTATCQAGFISQTITNDVYLVQGDVLKTTGLEYIEGATTVGTVIIEK